MRARRYLRSLLVLALAGTVHAAQKAQPPPAVSPEYLEMIERAAENEVEALQYPVPFRFHERLTWSWGSETRCVIETPEGRADRIIYFGDEPLQPDQQEKQRHRLEKLLRDRDAVKEDLQDQKAETLRRIRMVKAFPKSLIFSFARRENGLLVFSFRPNPEFSPKDRESQLYRGMEGEVWLEPVQERIVKVEGKLTKDVSFGWGVVGRLNKGGIYQIAQKEVAPGIWRITRLNVDVKGKMFLFSGFRFFREERNTAFAASEEAIGYRQAVEELLTMKVPVPGAASEGERSDHAPRSSLPNSEKITTTKPRFK